MPLSGCLPFTCGEAIAASAERTAVERDLRFAQLLFVGRLGTVDRSVSPALTSADRSANAQELNQVAHGRDLPPRLVLRMLRALARLGLKQPAMFFCLGALANLKTIDSE